jgi:hypothetical protein
LKKEDFPSLEAEFISKINPITSKRLSYEFSNQNFTEVPPGESLFKLCANFAVDE